MKSEAIASLFKYYESADNRTGNELGGYMGIRKHGSILLLITLMVLTFLGFSPNKSEAATFELIGQRTIQAEVTGAIGGSTAPYVFQQFSGDVVMFNQIAGMEPYRNVLFSGQLVNFQKYWYKLEISYNVTGTVVNYASFDGPTSDINAFGRTYPNGILMQNLIHQVAYDVKLYRLNKNSDPVVSVNTANILASQNPGYNTIKLTGRVFDPDGDQVTITATIGTITKSVKVTAPTAMPAADNWTLTWVLPADSVPEGVYTNITTRADDGK